MSAISALKNKIAAKNEEVTKKAEEMTKKAQDIARLNEEHMAIRDEFKVLSAEADQLNQKLVRLEELAAEEAEILASVTPAPVAVAEPITQPVLSEVTVFNTIASHDIKEGRISVQDFKDFVACSYQLAVDCAEPYRTKTEDEFKDQMKAVKKIDMDEVVGPHAAKKVHTFMKSGTENIGKAIVVAYDKGIGGGGEVRKITGSYRFSPMPAMTEDRPSGFYFHQFPTEFIRKLTPEEFNEVAASRPAYAINWTMRIAL
jgi:hypothetical protein